MVPFNNVTDPYILIRASSIVGLLSNFKYRFRHSKNFLNLIFILLLILGFPFISEKNAFAFYRTNSKTFVEKLKKQDIQFLRDYMKNSLTPYLLKNFFKL